MYSFAELNDFIIKHTDAKYFDCDLKLYKKHFPNSKLIPELDRCPDFAKRNLDERMLYELLNNQDSCIDCIWENRGFIFDGTKLIPANTPEVKTEKEAIEKELPKEVSIAPEITQTPTVITDEIEAMTYNQLKKTVFDLGLDKTCENHKIATYRNVLANYMQAMTNNKPYVTDNKKKAGRV